MKVAAAKYNEQNVKVEQELPVTGISFERNPDTDSCEFYVVASTANGERYYCKVYGTNTLQCEPQNWAGRASFTLVGGTLEYKQSSQVLKLAVDPNRKVVLATQGDSSTALTVKTSDPGETL